MELFLFSFSLLFVLPSLFSPDFPVLTFFLHFHFPPVYSSVPPSPVCVPFFISVPWASSIGFLLLPVSSHSLHQLSLCSLWPVKYPVKSSKRDRRDPLPLGQPEMRTQPRWLGARSRRSGVQVGVSPTGGHEESSPSTGHHVSSAVSGGRLGTRCSCSKAWHQVRKVRHAHTERRRDQAVHEVLNHRTGRAPKLSAGWWFRTCTRCNALSVKTML